jgi:hypothetical protein
VTADARHNNGDAMAYITREEHRDFANLVLENHGAMMRELAAIRGDIQSLKRREKSLPDLVASAIEEQEEITQVKELKAKLKEAEKEKAREAKSKTELRRALVLTVTGALAIVIAAIVLRWMHV